MGVLSSDYYSAVCDHCGETLGDEWGDGPGFMGSTQAAVDEEAAREGWIRVESDLVCSKCAQKVRAYEKEQRLVQAIALVVSSGHIVCADLPIGGVQPKIHADGEDHAVVFDGRDLNDNNTYPTIDAAERYLLRVERARKAGG